MAPAGWRRGYAADCKSTAEPCEFNETPTEGYQDKARTQGEPENRLTSSNRLPDLAAQIANMHQSVQLHEVAAAENALAAGGALIEAKALAGHGGWAAFLASACIPERTAQRYTRLWRSGLNPPQVADLGGVKATDAFLAKWKAPGPGAALFIGADDQEAIAYVWEDEGLKHHYHVLAIFGPGNEEECLATRCPMLWFAEVEGAQPVDTILTFLELNGFPVPMAAWRIETVEKRLAIGLRGLLVDG